jgi:hypothetical protein
MMPQMPDRYVHSMIGSVPPNPFGWYPSGYDVTGRYHGTYSYLDFGLVQEALARLGYPQALFRIIQSPAALYQELTGRTDFKRERLTKSRDLQACNACVPVSNSDTHWVYLGVRKDGQVEWDQWLVNGQIKEFERTLHETITVVAQNPPDEQVQYDKEASGRVPPPSISALTEQMLYRDLEKSGYSAPALNRLNKYYEDQYPLSGGNLHDLLLKRAAVFASAFGGQRRQPPLQAFRNYNSAVWNAGAGLLDVAGATIAGRTWEETTQNLVKGILAAGIVGSAFGILSRPRTSPRPGRDAVETLAPERKSALPAPSSSVSPGATTQSSTLIGTDRATFRTDAARVIRTTPDHPLSFLLDSEGNLISQTGLSRHADLADHPELVQAGHLDSAKGGGQRVVLQGAWENQFNNVTVETPSKLGSFMTNVAIDIRGVGVELETAKMWERYGLIEPGTVARAPRVR